MMFFRVIVVREKLRESFPARVADWRKLAQAAMKSTRIPLFLKDNIT
jgi:hypothetical protein